MFVIVGLMNYPVASHRILLGLYTLPTLFSAYFYGRRHATLTALASVLLVSLGTYYNKAMSPFDAKNIISKGSGTEFDPRVVKAFTEAFCNGELEIPNIAV